MCNLLYEISSIGNTEGMSVLWHDTGANAIRTGEFIQNRLESLQRHQQQLQAANPHQVGLHFDTF